MLMLKLKLKIFKSRKRHLRVGDPMPEELKTATNMGAMIAWDPETGRITEIFIP